jgi:o-succinylbenzoate synthase
VTAPPANDPPASVRLVRVRVPLRSVHRSAHGTDAVRDSVLVCWTASDGTDGWAECPTPTSSGYATETTDRAWSALVGELGPAAVAGTSGASVGAVAATAALADAALDARLRAAGVSLVDHLGGTRRPLPRTAVLAGVGDEPAVLAGAAVRAVADGATLVKVKVVPDGAAGVIRAVQDAVPGVSVAADANGSFGSADDVAPLDGLGLAYLEQPLAAGATWDDQARLCARLDTPVALDESLTSPDAVQSAVRAGAADVVSVKPARLGGVSAAALSVSIAAEHGVAAFVGGMFELGIGRAAAAAVATLAGCTLPTDLGPSDRYVVEDICEPVVADRDGRLLVPDGAGTGRVPDEERLARWTVDEVLLGR